KNENHRVISARFLQKYAFIAIFSAFPSSPKIIRAFVQRFQKKTDRCFNDLSPAATPPLTDLIPDI
ncbi:MAG: hypothetical protein LBL72_09115, partial [Candidatus Accumulibacter sp.]|nr:hypothetical protein [Accumulibacter sp.]